MTLKTKMEKALFDLEEACMAMVDCGLQWGDILNLTRGYLESHCPGAQEEYMDGTNPEFYYGPKKKS
jgi:hypothetical protein